jgi:hypothetical protein
MRRGTGVYTDVYQSSNQGLLFLVRGLHYSNLLDFFEELVVTRQNDSSFINNQRSSGFVDSLALRGFRKPSWFCLMAQVIRIAPSLGSTKVIPHSPNREVMFH